MKYTVLNLSRIKDNIFFKVHKLGCRDAREDFKKDQTNPREIEGANLWEAIREEVKEFKDQDMNYDLLSYAIAPCISDEEAIKGY